MILSSPQAERAHEKPECVCAQYRAPLSRLYCTDLSMWCFKVSLLLAPCFWKLPSCARITYKPAPLWGFEFYVFPLLVMIAHAAVDLA